MNVNNNSQVSFGINVNKDLVSSLEKDLSDRKGYRISNYKSDIKKHLGDRILLMSSWGNDSFELVETTNRVSNKKDFGIRKIGNNDFIQPMQPSNRKSLLTKFFILKKEDIERCIEEFNNAYNKKCAKLNITKQIIKFR